MNFVLAHQGEFGLCVERPKLLRQLPAVRQGLTVGAGDTDPNPGCENGPVTCSFPVEGRQANNPVCLKGDLDAGA
jgi:hypothetical protein